MTHSVVAIAFGFARAKMINSALKRVIARVRQEKCNCLEIEGVKTHFGRSRWMGRGLTFEIEQHNRLMCQRLHAQLLKMDPEEFEDPIGRLLAELGFEGVDVTRRSQDDGIEVPGALIVGDVIRPQMAIQVKRWKTKTHIQAPVVQQVRGSLGTHEQGLIITTGDFSVGAKREAKRPNAVPVA